MNLKNLLDNWRRGLVQFLMPTQINTNEPWLVFHFWKNLRSLFFDILKVLISSSNASFSSVFQNLETCGFILAIFFKFKNFEVWFKNNVWLHVHCAHTKACFGVGVRVEKTWDQLWGTFGLLCGTKLLLLNARTSSQILASSQRENQFYFYFWKSCHFFVTCWNRLSKYGNFRRIFFLKICKFWLIHFHKKIICMSCTGFLSCRLT